MPEMQLPFRRLLMLQGPVGPFFRLLARQLRDQGVQVWKINLNGGDSIYFPWPNVRAYRGKLEDWRGYLQRTLEELNIDSIALFGDCRAHHSAALAVAREADIPVFVFEEGYVRPDYITVELNGVNGHSRLIRPRTHARPESSTPLESTAFNPRNSLKIGNTFPALVLHCMLYWSAIDVAWPFYRHYQHHKPRSLAEIKPWLLSAIRKLLYARRDRDTVAHLNRKGTTYFLVPLQVHRDGQVMRDSGFLSVGHFIVTVIESFAAHAPVDQVLVLKQHPMDRGFTDYTALVQHTAVRLGCADRVTYIRDAHLPSLLQNARGTLTVNSTVGLSSLIHGTPVKVLGQAIYDQPGLTAQKSLREFWADPGTVDAQRVRIFIHNLIEKCQANGSFYTKRHRTGLITQTVQQMASQYVSHLCRMASTTERKIRPQTSHGVAVRPPQERGSGRSEGPNDTVH